MEAFTSTKLPIWAPVLQDGAAPQARERTDHRPRADTAAGADVGEGQDLRPRSDLHVGLDDRRIRIRDPHPGAHVLGAQPPANRRDGLGEIRPVVHPEQGGRIRTRHGLDVRTRVLDQPDRVGDVLLALGVVRGETRQRRPERVGAEHVESGVELAQGEFLRRRVGRLDDARKGPVGVADDAAEATRVRGHARQDGGVGAAPPVGLQEVLQVVGAHLRHVAVDQQDIPIEVGDRLEGDARGVAGSVLGLLSGGVGGRPMRAEPGLDLRGAVPGDDHGLRGLQRRERAAHVLQERQGEAVEQDLRRRVAGGTQAGALSCRQDEDRRSALGRPPCAASVMLVLAAEREQEQGEAGEDARAELEDAVVPALAGVSPAESLDPPGPVAVDLLLAQEEMRSVEREGGSTEDEREQSAHDKNLPEAGPSAPLPVLNQGRRVRGSLGLKERE